MQTCSSQNGLSASKKSKRWLAKRRFAIPVAAFLCAASFAQTEGAPVSNISLEPSVSPAMTAAVCPVVGSGFYELGAVFRLTGFHTQGEEAASFITAEQLQSYAGDESSRSSNAANTLGNIDQLTAQNILALDQAGVLSEIEQQILLNSWHPTEAQGAGETLSLLLHDIASLKATHSTDMQPATYKDNTAKADLLRFKLNGQDILENIAVIYISPAKEQRAFLLSLDLSSNADDTEQPDGSSTETLYLLFKPSGEFLQYKVAACSTSEGDEVGSFAKVFAALGDMEAFRTGSIVSLKSTTDGAQVDLLIDLGDEAN